MPIEGTAFYDADERTLWITRRFMGGGARVEPAEVRAWSKLLRGGVLEDGRPVAHVHILFGSEEHAAANYQTLAFVDLGVYYERIGNRLPYIPDRGPLEVDVRADFGIFASAEPEDE